MKLQQNFENQIRVKGLSRETQKTYWRHCLGYLKFFKSRDQWTHPNRVSDVEKYLTYLAVNKNVSPNTQNVALQSIIFLYRNCLGIQLTGVDAIRPKKPIRLPVVMNRDEVRRLINSLDGKYKLLAKLMYGCGLRISEAISVRVQDFDFQRGQLSVRAGKGRKDRFTCLPKNIKHEFEKQLDCSRRLWRKDNTIGNMGVSLPFAYGSKSPASHLDLRWYYLFPSESLSSPPGRIDVELRHHIHKTNVSRHFRPAVRRAGIQKKATPHTLRHSFATHLIESGVHIQQVSELLGHASIETTSIYLHCDSRNINERISPLDSLCVT